jgi:hypothetical protein
MEHFRQGSQQHTSGSFDVAEYSASLRPVSYRGAIYAFPVGDSVKKYVPVVFGTNPGHLKKDQSEPSSIGGLGGSAAPGQSLPLYMHQAPLHRDVGPEFPENLHHVGVAIDCEAMWAQSVSYQRLEKLQELRFRTLGDTILTGHKGASLCVHQSEEATRAMKVSPVQDKVLALVKGEQGSRWRPFQTAIDHTIKLARAVPALAGQLPGRVTLHHPPPEPFLLSRAPGGVIAPAKGALATRAKPALPAISIMAISLKDARATRAVFFCITVPSSLNRFNDCDPILHSSQS